METTSTTTQSAGRSFTPNDHLRRPWRRSRRGEREVEGVCEPALEEMEEQGADLDKRLYFFCFFFLFLLERGEG